MVQVASLLIGTRRRPTAVDKAGVPCKAEGNKMREAAWLYKVHNDDGNFTASEGWLRCLCNESR